MDILILLLVIGAVVWAMSSWPTNPSPPTGTDDSCDYHTDCDPGDETFF